MKAEKKRGSLGIKVDPVVATQEGRRYLRDLKALLKQGAGIYPNDLAAPTLNLRQSRWPVKKILFIVRGDPNDLPAFQWVKRLAVACNASVTLLVVYPDVPGFYNRYPDVQMDVFLLLNMETEAGTILRCMIKELSAYEISFTLSTHQALPDEQIRKEVKEGNHDLVVISKETRGRLWRLFFGELVKPLLGWIDRPVLAI